METKKYNLFLDDVRVPSMCSYVGKDSAVYFDLEWEIVRNYDQFVNYITENGLPEVVSFDHDLAEAHYHESMYKGGKVYMKYLETVSEKTGMDCAKWMVEYCIDKGLPVPIWYVHSMNPVGKENITSYITNYLKHSGQVQ
jgi:hypothetical protein